MTLHEKSHDQHQLRGNNDGDCDDVSAIRLPRRRGAESDLRTLWQPGRVDAPSPQLAPVDGGHQPGVCHRHALRSSTVEDLESHSCGANPRFARPAHEAADDAKPHVEIARAVHRHGRGFGHEPGDLVRIGHVAGLEHRLPDVEQDAARRNRSHGAQQTRQRRLFDVVESNSPGKARELGPHRLHRSACYPSWQ